MNKDLHEIQMMMEEEEKLIEARKTCVKNIVNRYKGKKVHLSNICKVVADADEFYDASKVEVVEEVKEQLQNLEAIGNAQYLGKGVYYVAGRQFDIER